MWIFSRSRAWLGAVVCAGLCAATAQGEEKAPWPQFRGPGGRGLAVGRESLPDELHPEKNVLWKTQLPAGHSSPVVAAGKVFLTAVEDGKLLTIGLDQASGLVQWRAEAPYQNLEKIHGIGSYAQASPATDGERVVALFGSCGLFCYSVTGELLWKNPMGPFNNDFGAGSSPLIVDDWVIVCQDHDTDSFLAAYDKRTGEVVWRTDRGEFPRNYCTPVLWEQNGRRQIVVAATLRVVGYDLQTGKEMWTVRGLSRAVCSTPVVGDDGTLYVTGWSAGADPGEEISLQPYAAFAAEHDKNQDGAFEIEEIPEDHALNPRFTQADRDKDGKITHQEYDYYRGLFAQAKNVVLAIRPGPEGDATATHVLWSADRNVPFCASSMYHQGLLFTVKDGGIFTAFDAKSGKVQKTGRLDATEEYYASPIAGDGKIYLANQEGQVSVVTAEGKWQVLHTADFNESIFASPAIVNGRIYLRTAGHLYCFGR